MGIFRQFPYSNFHEMNMDDIIKLVKTFDERIDLTEQEWKTYKDYIDNYFDNLDVSEEVYNSLRIMLSDGSLSYVTPEMFGAVGDGITNDTQAVREALSSDVDLVIMIGTYYVNEKINITNNKTIIGGGSIYSPSFDEKQEIFHITCKEITINGIDFKTVRNSNYVYPPAGHTRDELCLVSNVWFINAHNVDRITLENVTFENSEYDFNFYDCENVIVNNFKSFNASGCTYFSGNDNIVISNGYIKLYTLLGTGDHAIYGCYGNDRVEINNIDIEYSSALSSHYPIHIYATNDQISQYGLTKDVYINNCYIEYAENCFATMVSSRFLVTSSRLIAMTSATQNKLFYCEAPSSGAYFCIENTIISALYSNNDILFNNTLQSCTVYFKNCQMQGPTIRLDNVYNARIVFDGCRMTKILSTSAFDSEIEIYRCRITGSSDFAIYLNTVGRGVKVEGCYLVSAGDGLISVRADSEEVLLLNCTGMKSGASDKLEYNGESNPIINAVFCYMPDVAIRSGAVNNINSVFKS